MQAGTSSFVEFLAGVDPQRLPGGSRLNNVESVTSDRADITHGTTIVAATFDGGVVMAGDRRATAGNVIAQRDIEKVFAADDHTVVGIAGTAGIAIELVRLFQVELEHYEKMEGASLSLEGKANRLSLLLRGNLGMAMQGLAVVPLFAGFDLHRGHGRIYSYDVTGGRYEEHGFHAVGSGSVFARGSLKKLYYPTMTRDAAVAAVIEALYDAADDDSATGGPDVFRAIYPIVAVVEAAGVEKLDEATVAAFVTNVLSGRAVSPNGPIAAMPNALPSTSAQATMGDMPVIDANPHDSVGE